MKSKSFLRWAGSKQKLIPLLRSYWDATPDVKRYVEPFMGSAQLFFSLNPDKAILSDLNLQLVEVFQQVQKNPYPIHKILKGLPTNEKTYYKVRSIDPKTLGINQRVARFIYLNRLCFNGLYRTNNSGIFNVPFSKAKIDHIDDLELLKQVAGQLINAKIESGDFETIIRKHVKKGDFVYLDPPFAVENRRIFKQYGPQTFGLEDLLRLKELLFFIEQKGGSFLLSYAYCKEALQMFNSWPMKKTFTQRNIAGFSSHRKKAAEVLITNIELDEFES